MKPEAPPIDPKKRSTVPPPEVLSEPGARMVLRVFLAMLIVPVLFQLAGTNYLTAGVRSVTQWVLTHVLNEGNRRVFLGHDGWLFEQRELDRIVDLKRAHEPASLSLTTFADDLKKRGIPLVLVAVPERVTIYPDKVRGSKYRDAVRSTGEKARLDALRASGVEVLDVTELLWKLRDEKRRDVFFAHDSNWTPEAMKAVALQIEKHLREKHRALTSEETPLIKVTVVPNEEAGNLSRQLDPLMPQYQLGMEKTDLVSVEGIELDEKSPVLLMGTELTAAFGDASDFITQLGLLLCRPIDFALWPAPNSKVEGKQLVVLVLPMSEILP